MYMYMYMYMCVCVCECVCVWEREGREGSSVPQQLHQGNSECLEESATCCSLDLFSN